MFLSSNWIRAYSVSSQVLPFSLSLIKGTSTFLKVRRGALAIAVYLIYLGINPPAIILIMEVAIFMVERFQKNNRWTMKAETKPAEINPTFTISWSVSLSLKLSLSSNLCGVFAWTSVAVLLILFEGWCIRGRAEGWEVSLLIFDEPPFVCLTPTGFISKFIDFLTPSSMSLFVFFRLLLYPTVLWVLRRRFEGMSQVSGETARWSLTFDSSIALRNVWLSDRILNQYQELTLGFEFLRASWLTQDWWSDIDFWTKNAVNECLNRLIQSRHPSLRQTFWLVCHEEVELPVNQFALSLLMKEIRFPLMAFPHPSLNLLLTGYEIEMAIGPAFVT